MLGFGSYAELSISENGSESNSVHQLLDQIFKHVHPIAIKDLEHYKN